MANDFLIVTPLRILPLPLVPPLGPINLRSFARMHGFNGEVLDFNALLNEGNIDSYDEIVRKSLEDWMAENPETKVVGINVLFSGVFPRALAIAKVVKSIKPDVITVMGGIHPTLHYREILAACPDVDQVVIGEGELEFVRLLERCVRGSVAAENVADGLAMRQDGKVVVWDKTNYTTKRNINELGPTDYSGIDYSKYHSSDMDRWYNPKGHDIVCAVPIVTSRSCPFRCNFCSIHAVHGSEKTFRYRPADDVIEEIKFLYYEKQIRYFYIVDDCANCGKKSAMELYSKLAATNIDISLEFQNGLRISTFDDELIDAMVAAGMVRGGLAIESGSEYIRNKIIGKTLPEEKIDQVYNYFRKNHPHVWLLAFFILGLPEETVESLDATAALIKRVEWMYPVFNTAVPTPGTKLWDQCVADNLLQFPSEDAWRNCFIFGFNRHTMPWSMKGANLFPETFIIKPYNLELDVLRARYEEFLVLGQERLAKVKGDLIARLPYRPAR